MQESEKDEIYVDTVEFIDCIIEDYDYYSSLLRTMSHAETKVAFNYKSIKRNIDEAWVSIIEQSLPYLDTIIRNPSRDIKEEEEVLPIELSRNIKPRSIVHLAQHSNYIKDIDEKGNIIPSKILNVYRDESLLTYENKFVNTLVDRLNIFIDRRYEKLSKSANDEEGSVIDLGLDMNLSGTSVKMSLKIETTSITEKNKDSNSLTIWDRVEKIRKIVSAYSSSTFIQSLHGAKVSPPIMRTNAIMKNYNLRQCLILWQFIESYDKVGYNIEENEIAGRPKKELIDELYALMAFQYVVFRYNTTGSIEEGMGRRKNANRSITPKVISEIEETSQNDYNLYVPEGQPYKQIVYEKAGRRLTSEEIKIKKAVERALKSEKEYKSSLMKARKNEKNR